MTGFPSAVRAVIHRRADWWCERCGVVRGTEAHHRRTRAMGGTKRGSTNVASNAGWLCEWCHRWITGHPDIGRQEGWVVRQKDDPATIPVRYRGTWVLLDDLGNMKETV